MDENTETKTGRKVAADITRALLRAHQQHGISHAALAGGALEAAIEVAITDMHMSPTQIGQWLTDCADALLRQQTGAAPVPASQLN